MTGHISTEAIARARAVPIADEILRGGIKLRRVERELVGGCPVCGDGGKGSRSNRFAVHLCKNVWLCRRCQIAWSAVKGRTGWNNAGIRQAAEAAGVDLTPFVTTSEPGDRLTITIRGDGAAKEIRAAKSEQSAS
jgi:hypothetical protein